MSDGGDNVQRQTSEPSDWAKGYLTPGMDEAKTLFGEGPARHYTEDNGSAIYGFGSQTDQGLTSLFNRGMGGAGQRAGAQNALDQFAGGGLGDWNNYGDMRNLGLANNWASNPATTRLGDMSMSNQYEQNPVYGTLAGLNSGGGMNLSKNLYDRIGGLTQDGGNIAGRTDSQLGNLLNDGGNVAGFSQGAVGDITQSGAGSNSQIRGDINDLITGQAQAANPAYQSLGLTASGAMLNSNPYLDSTYDQAADRVTRDFRTSTSPAIDGRFAMTSGGSGSGAAQIARDSAERNLGDTLSGLATSVYGGNYGQERDRQLGAASTLGSQYLQGQNLRASTAGQSAAQAAEDARLRLGATGQISGDMAGDQARKMQAVGMSTDAASQDLARRMQSAQQMTGAEQQDWTNLTGNLDRMSQMYDTGANRQLQANDQLSRAYESGADRQLNALNSSANAYTANRGQQLQGLGLQPQYQQMDYTDIEKALGAGGARDTLGQQQLDERVSAFDFGQNSPWNNVQRYLALTGGGSPSTTTSMTGGNNVSPLAGILSALGGAGSLYGMLR